MKQTCVTLMLLCVWGCGSSLLERSITEGSAVIDNWVSEMPAQRLREKCAESQGTLFDSVTVGACAGGTVHLSLRGGDTGDADQDQPCGDGTGGAYPLQCAHQDPQGLWYWNDGPSVPAWLQAVGPSISDKFDPAKWTYLAWDAAVNHDTCYHHNGATFGYDKDACDGQFFADLSALCAADKYRDISWFTKENCQVNAAAMFAAVQVAGQAPWAIMNSEVHYPAYVPQWQQLGLPGDVADPLIKALAEKFASGATGS